MNTRMIITVTSVEGQPTLDLPGSLTGHEVRKIVRERFGLQACGNTPAIPHSFCGAMVPPPAPSQAKQTITTMVMIVRNVRCLLRIVSNIGRRKVDAPSCIFN